LFPCSSSSSIFLIFIGHPLVFNPCFVFGHNLQGHRVYEVVGCLKYCYFVGPYTKVGFLFRVSKWSNCWKRRGIGTPWHLLLLWRKECHGGCGRRIWKLRR
jgi:hypothetical protein